MPVGSGSHASGSPSGRPAQTKFGPAEVRCYLEEGLEGVERQQYRNARSFSTAIEKRIREFQLGGPAQYAVFGPVTDDEFTKIHKIRHKTNRGLRFLYLTNERMLIVKFIVGVAHEQAHRRFVGIFMLKISSMGLFRDFIDVGGGCFTGLTGRKEADTGLKPISSRPFLTDWPTVAVECGVSESLERLRVDAKWWLENSEGAVGTVVIITVSEKERSVCMEKWELADMPNPHVTEAEPEPFITGATRTGGGKIIAEIVTGAPLKISFKKTMLRDPDEGLGEGDIVFDVEDFEEIAEIAWVGSE